MATTCPYCGVGCGVVAEPGGAVVADRTHPSSRGLICSKGAALGETLDDRDRLRTARVDGAAVPVDAALDHVAEAFRHAIDEWGPDSVAFYLSGQMLTEDYYVANKLMKGFIGSGNVDTNSRLCMASTVAGHKRAFGADIVPGIYEDLDETDLAVLVGSNSAWCHPVLHQRLLAARAARGMRIVVIDPRRTQTAIGADLHLPVAPDGDTAIFAGLLRWLDARGAIDRAWAGAHASGLADALAAAASVATVETAATAAGVEPDLLRRFYEMWTETPRVVTLFSQGVNQSIAGTDKVNAIINVHLATGRISRPGAGPFSLTGQPNAMGGREVGGLATMLAAHMDFSDAERDRVGRFWRAPRVAARPGLRAVELFEAVADGRIKALWIAATNPAATMPRAGAVADALRACPFVAVSDCWETDTTRLARVVLPAAGWGEKDGTVTNSERRVSRQRRFREAPGEARADWRLFAGLAQRLGFADAFGWDGSDAVFREWAAMTAFENGGTRLLDLGALAGLSRAEYDAMRPQRWPLPAGGTGEGGRLFADGRFPTPDGRARMVAVTPASASRSAGMPFVLNTGRIRDQWHTMTRTGAVPRLMTHVPAPTLAMNGADLLALGVSPGDPVELATADGRTVLPVAVDAGLRPGTVFAPMHWTDTHWAGGPVGRAVRAAADPHSGQPGLKATPARVTPMLAHWHGVLLCTEPPATMPSALWSRAPLDNGVMLRLIGLDPLAGADWWRSLRPEANDGDDHELVEFSDRARGTRRAAWLRRDRLVAFGAVAPTPGGLPPTEWLSALLGTRVPDAMRLALFSGRPPAGASGGAAGRVSCACFGVTASALRRLVGSEGIGTVEEIGRLTKAGTNCRSCLPEIEEILREVRHAAA